MLSAVVSGEFWRSVQLYLLLLDETIDWLKMQDVKMTDHQNCRAWNCKTWKCRTGNCRTWKWRTKNDDRAWNGGRKKYRFNRDSTTM